MDRRVPNFTDIDDDDYIRIKRLRREKQLKCNLEKFEQEQEEKSSIPTSSVFEVPDDFPIDPFNMRNEETTGKFDKQGYYIFKKKNPNETNEEEEDDEDNETVSDPWLASLKNNPDAYATTKPSVEPKEEVSPEEKELQQITFTQLINKLADLLNPNETPAAALRRYSDMKQPNNKRLMEPKAKIAFDTITKITDNLILTQDAHDIFNIHREDLLKLENNVQDESEEMYWQYRWCNQKNGQIYGPNKSSDILRWIEEGYVSDKNPLEVREVLKNGEPTDGIWHLWTDVRFSGEQYSTEEEKKKLDEVDKILKEKHLNKKSDNEEDEDDEDDDEEDFGL